MSTPRKKSDLVTRASQAGAELPYWRRKSLAEMTQKEWEGLCDGCGKCCLNKLEYQDTGLIEQTNVACKLLDTYSCQCRDYPNRKKHVPDCIQLTPRKIKSMDWLPSTCGYRLVAAGKDLYWWHPLVSGDPQTVHRAGISVRGRVISETDAGPLEDHVVNWDDK